MSLNKDEWSDGITEEGKPMACARCLLLALVCLVLDALTIFAGWQLAALVGDIISG